MINAAAFYCAIAVVGASPLAAQTKITPDAFLDQAEGHTLTFRNFRTDRLVGIEQFLDRTRSVWARENGTCTYGRIEIEGGLVCFRYEDQSGTTHCWQPYVHEGDLLLISLSRDIQRISQISDEPVICQDAPLS